MLKNAKVGYPATDKIIEFGTRRKVSQKYNSGIEQILVFILCLDQQVIGKQKKLYAMYGSKPQFNKC